MNAKTNVLIVGAGPAGSALGLLLCRAGVDVLVTEAKDVSLKDKLCGGILNSEAVILFADIYGKGTLEELGPHHIELLVNRAWDASMSVPCVFSVLPRARFDAFCLAQYESAGGRVVDRMRLVGIDQGAHVARFRDGRSGETVEVGYRTLVGADGARSAVRRLTCGCTPRTTIALQGNTTLPNDMSSNEVISDQRTGEHGCCWFIPQGAHAVVGGLFHHADMAYARMRLDGFCESLGVGLDGLRGASIPTGDDVLLGTGDGIWFVGDAAGLIDAGTGAGIHHALSSARALARALAGGEPYEQAMSRTSERVRTRASEGELHNLRACLGIAMASRRRGDG